MAPKEPNNSDDEVYNAIVDEEAPTEEGIFEGAPLAQGLLELHAQITLEVIHQLVHSQGINAQMQPALNHVTAAPSITHDSIFEMMVGTLMAALNQTASNPTEAHGLNNAEPYFIDSNLIVSISSSDSDNESSDTEAASDSQLVDGSDLEEKDN